MGTDVSLPLFCRTNVGQYDLHTTLTTTTWFLYEQSRKTWPSSSYLLIDRAEITISPNRLSGRVMSNVKKSDIIITLRHAIRGLSVKTLSGQYSAKPVQCGDGGGGTAGYVISFSRQKTTDGLRRADTAVRVGEACGPPD